MVYGCYMHVDKACRILAYQKQRKDSLIVMDVTCKRYPKLICFCICHSQVCMVLFYVTLSHIQTYIIVTHSKSLSWRKLPSVKNDALGFFSFYYTEHKELQTC